MKIFYELVVLPLNLLLSVVPLKMRMRCSFWTLLRWSLLLSVICIISVSLLATQTANEKEYTAATFAISFGRLSMPQFDWGGIFPSFDEVMKWKFPVAELNKLIKRIANLSRFADHVPTYFMEGTESLKALNLLLNFTKFVAVYGRKIFFLSDVLRTKVFGIAGSEGDDGTVKVYETTTDLEALGVLELLSKKDLYLDHGKIFIMVEEGSEEVDSVDFSSCQLKDRDVEGLVTLISRSEMSGRQLIVGRSDITYAGWNRVGARLASVPQADSVFNFKSKSIVNVNGLLLPDVKSLETLDLQNQHLGTTEAYVIALCIKNNNSLRHLNVSNNEISEKAALALVNSFKDKQMKTVELANCSLGTDSAKAIAEYVNCSSSLTMLDTRQNAIDYKSAEQLASAVFNCKTIDNFNGLLLSELKSRETLDLQNQSLGTTEAYVIALCIKDNNSLRHLNVSNNEISEKAALALVNSFKDKQMKTVELANCSLGTDSAKAIAEYVNCSSSLTMLDTRRNAIDYKSAEQLVKAVLNSKSMVEFGGLPLPTEKTVNEEHLRKFLTVATSDVQT